MKSLQRLSASLVLTFAVLSLLLASVGLYGVLSYLMTQRTTELGVRMALRAQRDQVLRLMLFDVRGKSENKIIFSCVGNIVGNIAYSRHILLIFQN